jgi:Flp pilus assembly protein TadG
MHRLGMPALEARRMASLPIRLVDPQPGSPDLPYVRSAPDPAVRAHRSARGQALAEFAIVVPLLLAFVGLTLDFARVYQVWMKLQAVTRDTAEYLATDPAITTIDQARTEATVRLCTAMAGTTTCPETVRLVALGLATTGDPRPIWRAEVGAEYDFQTQFLYPIIRGLTGADRWVLRTDMTFEILRDESP